MKITIAQFQLFYSTGGERVDNLKLNNFLSCTKDCILLYCQAGRNAGFQFYQTLCTGLKGTAKPNLSGARMS